MSALSLPLTGANPMTGQLKAFAGTEGTPGISFDGDPNTGFYASAADTIVAVAGALGRFQVDASGITILNAGAFIGNLTGNVTGGVTGAVAATTISASGVVSISAGSAAAPAVGFTGDTNTGFYSSGADVINVTTGGTSRGTFSSAGWTGAVVGNATTATLAATATAWATGRTISLTGDATGTSGSIDGTANGTLAATLATVNSNTGSFGSTTAIPVITVNGKGLITAVTTATPTPTVAYTRQARSSPYTFVLGDAGSVYYYNGSGPADTFTIPSNASVPYASGTVIKVLNSGSAALSIAITSDALTWFTGAALTTGTRTIAVGGWVELIKSGTTTWSMTGAGIT